MVICCAAFVVLRPSPAWPGKYRKEGEGGEKEEGMCEIHYFKCTSCGRRWEAHKKLASCEDFNPETRCPASLLMYVGVPRRPEKGECGECKNVREMLECLEDGDEV